MTPRLVGSYIANHQVRKLHLGAGPVHLPGWLNTDIEPEPGQAYIDAADRYPLGDRAFRYVFSEHLIEHLDYEQGLAMLKESYRVLEPGGRVRIHTPNLAKFLALFDPNQPEAARQFLGAKHETFGLPRTVDPATYVLNVQMHAWGHQFLYTPKLLRKRLEEVGFKDVREVPLAESSDPALHGLSSRLKGVLVATDQYETMAFEAVRP